MRHVLDVKQRLSPSHPFGIGLRLSDRAARELAEPARLAEYKAWLERHDCYVFTLNGFPYGGFHGEVVKDRVHAPDWTTGKRLNYTILLFDLLAELLPEKLAEGSISTSPLSYRPWFPTESDRATATRAATLNLMRTVLHLLRLKQRTGKSFHLDLEPEPDGLLDNSRDLIQYFHEEVLTAGLDWLHRQMGGSRAAAESAIREHLAFCWDICHVAVAFEEPAEILRAMQSAGIRIGKLQISAALKAYPTGSIAEVQRALQPYAEPVYLHQASLLDGAGRLHRFTDLAPALAALNADAYRELRTHFHVPIYAPGYGLLQSTNDTIVDTLRLWKEHPFTNHLEVETYTWDVLPSHQRLGLTDSIVRELRWVEFTLATKLQPLVSSNRS
jgi:hypothetical protein